ncbi:MAG TPA: hypothetical protein VF463_07900 [Sphingobium sp.]
MADLASHANLIAIARPRGFAKVESIGSATLPGTQRYYVDAQVDSLIRGDGGLAPRIAFLIDVPISVKPSRAMKGKPFVLFGRAGGDAGQFQLLSSNALLPSSPGTDARVRAITAELLAQDAAPEIVRVVEAFHVEGTIAGESETQIFLATQGGRPVSLSIIRRPDMAPRFGAALGEIVDEAADVPAPDTLLWYRLACGLPPALPAGAADKLDAPAAAAAAADYRSFMDRLGTCLRSRGLASDPLAPTLGKPANGG